MLHRRRNPARSRDGNSLRRRAIGYHYRVTEEGSCPHSPSRRSGLGRRSSRCVALALAVAAAPVFAQADRIRPVTYAELANPSPDEWLMWRRTLDGWGCRRSQWNPGYGESNIISTALLFVACILLELEIAGG